MFNLEHRSFITAIAISAILITGVGAAPARAGQDDVAKALAALAGLAVLGIVIKNATDDDKKARAKVKDRRYGRDERFHEEARVGRPKPLPRRVERKLLPQTCLRSVETVYGAQRQHVFGKRCLKRNYEYTDLLPRTCERRFRTYRGERKGFGARCLSRNGYVLARR